MAGASGGSQCGLSRIRAGIEHATGDSVTVYDATRRRTEKQRFSLVSPCRIARTRALPDGTSVKTYDTFVFARDGLHVAQAPASGGFRRDGRVTAYIDDHVYTFEVQSTALPAIQRQDGGALHERRVRGCEQRRVLFVRRAPPPAGRIVAFRLLR